MQQYLINKFQKYTTSLKKGIRFDIFLTRIAPFFFIALFFLLAIEPTIDRFYRSFLYKHTDLAKQIIKETHFFISDICIILFFGSLVFSKSIYWKSFFSSAVFRWCLVFLCGLLFSVLFSPMPSDLCHYMHLFYWSLTGILFGLVHWFFQKNDLRKFLKILFVSLFFLALFECTLGICQYFSQSCRGFQLLGEKRHFDNSIIAVQDQGRWIFDVLLKNKFSNQCLIRICGTFFHSNCLSGFLVLTLLVSFGLCAIVKNKYKVFVCIGIFIQIFTLFLTYSRASLLAFFIGIICWFWFARKVYKIKHLMIVFLVSCTFSSLLILPQLKHRGGIFNYNQFVQKADMPRVQAGIIAIKMIKDFPVLGVGFQNYGKKGFDYADQFIPVHNIYLLVGSEGGLLTLAAFFIFLFIVLKKGWNRRFDPLFLSLFSVIIAYMVIGFFDYYIFSFHHGKILFLIAAFLSVCPKNYPIKEAKKITLLADQ